MAQQLRSTTIIKRWFRLPASGFQPAVYDGPSYENAVAARNRSISQAMKTHFKKPLLIHQGHKQWLFDHHGKRYLDMYGGIVTVSVGHAHPRINEALRKQTEKLWHVANIYTHPLIHQYAEKLLSTMPKNLSIVYLVNSGSEANDLAVLLARLATGNHDIVALRNGYHGGNSTCIGLNGMNTWKYPLTYSNIYHAKNPDVYKGRFGGKACRDSPIQTNRNCSCEGNICKASDSYADDVREIIQYCTPKGKIAGFIAESIQGVGGVVQYPKNYIKSVYELVRKAGGVCIADEVQTGFARTGDHFWGFQGHGVEPDIVTMAKGIGNGFPLGAVVTSPAIARAMESACHYNTFSGNPLACAVGLEVLNIIEEEQLQNNAKSIGSYLLQRLAVLRDHHPEVGDVRGKGFMIGVEMVQDQESRSPLHPTAVQAIWETCREHGLLIGLGGFHSNVYRIKPPMCVTKEDVDFTVDVLQYAIEKNLPKV